MNLVTLILDNWRLILLAMVIASIGTLYGWGSYHRNRANDMEIQLEELKRLAREYEQRSDQIAKEIGDAIPRVVEQAEANAYKNYLAKYGRGNAACGIGAVRLPTQHGSGEAVSAERTDDPSREFVVACATDAGRLKLWQDWAIANDLPVQ